MKQHYTNINFYKQMNITINDWVQFNVEGKLTKKRVTGIQDNGKFIQTEETDVYYTENIYKPIPFTPEIMEKNRFKLNEKETALLSRYDTKVLVYDFPEVLGNRFFIEYNVEKKVAYLTDHCFTPIRYVNEFQQLLRLMSTKVKQAKQILNNFVV